MQSEQPGGWTTAAPPPPQQQGSFPHQYQQQQQQPTVTQFVTHRLNFGKQPVTTTCTNCNSSITTVLRENTGIFQHVVAAVLCMVGCWPCCLIPYCMDDLQDVT